MNLLISAILLAFSVGCGGEGGDMSITDVTPRFGALQGDMPVQIVGSNFRTDIGYTVYFGTKRAPSVAILNPTTLVARAPGATEEGPVDITIRADNGAAFRISQAFDYRDVSAEAAAAQKNKGNLEF